MYYEVLHITGFTLRFAIAELRSLTAPYNTPDVPQRAFIYGALSPYLGIDDMRWMFIDNASPEKIYEHNPALNEYIFRGEVANIIRGLVGRTK